MPDLDQIRIDGTTYDLKDSTAREKNAVQDNELYSLKSAFDQVFKTTENVAETKLIKAKTNYDVTNNNNGTYTIGTTSYGTVVFGIEMTLKPGIYMLYGVQEGYSFLSSDGTASAQNSAIAINPTPNPKWVAITEDTTCYIGFRNDARPSASFIITPYLCIDSLAQTKNDINELNSNFDSLNEFCRKEIVTETSGSIPVRSGTEISSSNHLVDVSIASGETFKFKLNANGNLTSYHLYANGSALKYNCIAGTEYTLSKSSAITWLSIFVAGANVTGTGVVEGVVKQFSYTTDSLEERIENVQAEADNTKDTVGSIIDAETVFLSGEYEIGASVNNNGNATYIYHEVLFNIDGTKMIGILCDDIVNATAEFPIVVLEKDSSNTTLKRHDISKSVATRKDGVKIQPIANTTKIIVELYPSTTGGLTTQTAKYKNINIFTSNDGTYSIRNRNIPNLFSVPNYYLNAANDSYLQNKVSTIEGLIKDAAGNCDVFFFCTDQHWTLNAKQSPNLMNYICQRLNIQRMFMGGDYADGLNLNALKAYRDAFPGKIYDVIGNHEYMNYLAEIGESLVSHPIDDGDIWAYINLHMTDAVSGDFSRNYYYVDNAMQKMRYIVLNVYADDGNAAKSQFEDEQKSWLTNAAMNLPSGYTAIIFAHRLLGVNYNTGEIIVRPECEEISNIVDAYNGSGEIACLIAGHTHVDGMSTTPGGIPIFVTTCDKYLPWTENGVDKEPWLTSNRHLGTITEQAFDVVVIDKTSKLISFVRIGAPADNGTGTKLQIRQQYYGS